MRAVADAERIHRFMVALGRVATTPSHVYFTGGATAVLEGWRVSTVDVDIKLVPDADALLRAIQELKDSLQVNVELAAPDDFIPVRAGWPDRSPFVTQEGPLSFHHFDLEAQALAKIERGHALDLLDVRAMIERRLVDADRLMAAFDAIAPELYRYPAIDTTSFRASVERVVADVRKRRP